MAAGMSPLSFTLSHKHGIVASAQPVQSVSKTAINNGNEYGNILI
jgi:hypothetical protein